MNRFSDAHMDDERRSFPTRTASWPAVRDFVEQRCRQLAVPRGAALRLELVAEELFINLATHVKSQSASPPVEIAIRDVGDEMELVMEDRFAVFDPFSGVVAPDREPNPQLRQVGGLGRALVMGVASRCFHEPLPGGNRVTVAIAKAAGAGRK